MFLAYAGWGTRFVQTPLSRNGRSNPYEKDYFLSGIDFLMKEVLNPTPNLAWEKSCFLSIEWIQGCWVSLDKSPTLRPLRSVAVAMLYVVLIDAYNINITRSWCLPIDMDGVLFVVDFEDGLAISVWRDKATGHINLKLKIEKFIKAKPF